MIQNSNRKLNVSAQKNTIITTFIKAAGEREDWKEKRLLAANNVSHPKAPSTMLLTPLAIQRPNFLLKVRILFLESTKSVQNWTQDIRQIGEFVDLLEKLISSSQGQNLKQHTISIKHHVIIVDILSFFHQTLVRFYFIFIFLKLLRRVLSFLRKLYR